MATNVLVPRRATPSYASGYARSASESANPGLWRDLVFAPVPLLGPTGNSLIDVVGGEVGTLANMDPATDWVVEGGRYALDFDGSDDQVTFSAVNSRADMSNYPVCTFAEWIWVDPSSAGNDMHFGSGYDSGWMVDIYNKQPAFWVGAASPQSTVTLDTGKWVFLAIIWRDADYTAEFWVDGVYQQEVQRVSDDSIASRPDIYIGRNGQGSNFPFLGKLASNMIWGRRVVTSELQHLYRDPLAPFRLKSRVFSFPAATPAASTTSTFLIPRRAKPSYQSGYAHSASQSANPGLWRGQSLAVAPSMGITGTTVRDMTGYNRHGAATGSQIWDHRGIEHTVVGDRINFGDASFILPTTEGLTVLLHYEKTDATNRNSGSWGMTGGTANGALAGTYMPWSTGTVYFDYGGTSGDNRITVAGLTFGDDKWAFTTGQRGLEIWHNGIRVASNGVFTTRTSDTTDLQLGTYNYQDSDLAIFKVFAVYKRQLSISEIQLFTRDPIAQWRLKSRMVALGAPSSLIIPRGLSSIEYGSNPHGLHPLGAGITV